VLGLLSHFEGKDEWTLRMRADANTLSDTLQATRPDLIALKEDAEHLPDGRAYFARKMLQKATAEIVSAMLALVEHGVYQRLAAAGIDLAPVDPPHPSGKGAGGILANAPLLVERRRFAELETILAGLEHEHVDAGLAFELVGPWPPYSFTTNLDLTGAHGCQE
jgi:hypothetical protein